MKPVALWLTALTLLVAHATDAHHSFAIYDIDNKIERTGRLSQIVFGSPHIRFVLEVDSSDGTTETWDIESLNPGRWDQAGIPRNVVGIDEDVTIRGWPARDGTDQMLLSAIITERGTTVVTGEVRQGRAREDIPEVTIRRE
jgi:hypothetical protein